MEIVAHLQRLRKIKENLLTKGYKLIRRNYKSIEELEELEQAEADKHAHQESLKCMQQQEQETLTALKQARASEAVNQASIPADNPSFSKFLGLTQGSFSGNPLEGARYSLNA